MADWTETYRPTTLSEVRGNDSARDELREWARTWPEHREAVVVHGSPGVGKTSAALALAADMGWDVVELNASDQRTADVIERVAGEAATSGTLTGGAGGRRLILLDEADNLHGNYDRGGAAAISRIVAGASQPVVLVANDYYEMSRGLRSACREIEFRDIPERSLLPVLRDICRREDVEYDDEALEAIVEENGGDLRGAINDLQAIAETTRRLTVDDVTTGERDRTRGIFEFLDDVLKEEDAEGALGSAYDADETPDDLINWIEDNLPKDYEGAELAEAYGFLARADKWLGRVRATQDYSYWRYATDEMAAGVAAARDGPKGGWTRYGPPSYWRKLGASRSSRDRRDYVARKVAERSGTSTATARRVVLPYLAAMTHHCTNRELTVAMAAAYELDEEHVAFVTGSGKDTNKVRDVVADAERLREEAAVAGSGGAFEGAERTTFAGLGAEELADGDAAGEGDGDAAGEEDGDAAGEEDGDAAGEEDGDAAGEEDGDAAGEGQSSFADFG